ncbi:MAG: hypothetical protein WCT33_04945 [Patescibacteria group bacterium]
MMGETTVPDQDNEMTDAQFEVSDPNQDIERAIEALTDEGNYDEAASCLQTCDAQISGGNELDPEKLNEFKQALDEVRDDLDAETLGAFDEILVRIESKMAIGE